MNETEVFAALEDAGAVRRGHFILSSGLHSDTYVQCAKVLQWPRLAERLGHELGSRLSVTRPTVVLSLALGGLVIGHETARELGVRAVFCERVDGRMLLRRGLELEPGDRVAVVEDVVTTGGSPHEALDLVRDSPAEAVAVGAIVDRSEGVAFGVRFEALGRLRASRWRAEQCPQCAVGGAADAPGSRYLRA